MSTVVELSAFLLKTLNTRRLKIKLQQNEEILRSYLTQNVLATGEQTDALWLKPESKKNTNTWKQLLVMLVMLSNF